MNAGWSAAFGLVLALAGVAAGLAGPQFAGSVRPVAPMPKETAPALWAAPVALVGTAEKGKRVVAVRRDGRVESWDRATGTPGKSFRLALKQPAALSADGALVASQGRDDGPLVVQDTATGKEVGRTPKWPRPAYDAAPGAFSPDNRLLARPTTWSGGVVVSGWPRAGEKEQGRPVEPRVLETAPGWHLTVAFSPDGSLLAGTGGDEFVELWSVEGAKRIKSLGVGKAAIINWVQFSPDGKTLVSADGRGQFNGWDATTGKPAFRKKLELGGTVALSAGDFSPDGKLIALGLKEIWFSSHGAVFLADARTGKSTGERCEFDSSCTSLRFTPDGKSVVAGSYDGRVMLLDVWKGKLVRGYQPRSPAAGHLALAGHPVNVWHLAFSPDGRTLVSADREGAVKVWDVRTRKEIRTLRVGERPTAIALSPDGKLLVTASGEKGVTAWDLETGAAVARFRGGMKDVCGLTFSPDGTLLAAGGGKQVELWDVRTDRVRHTLKGHTARVHYLSFSPDGKTLASMDSDGQLIRLWDTTGGRELRALACQPEFCHPTLVSSPRFKGDVRFTPDGKSLLTTTEAGQEGLILLLDPQTGELRRRLPGADSNVHTLVPSPEGSLAAEYGQGGPVRVWDLKAGRLVAEFGHRSGPMSSSDLAFSPDGKLLAYADDSATNGVFLADVTELKRAGGEQ